MRNLFKIFLFFLVIFVLGLNLAAEENDIRKPVVAGGFYPSDKEQLSSLLDGLFAQAEAQKPQGKKVYALISPHAGYVYSGKVAAHGYKLIQGEPYKTVIVIAPSHYYKFSGIALWPKGALQTPLGNIPIDEEFAEMLSVVSEQIKHDAKAFEKEHALEVQLPFLQKALGDFKLVPLIVGFNIDLKQAKIFAKILSDMCKNRDDVLVVASTDLAHVTTYEKCLNTDKQTIKLIKNKNLDDLYLSCAMGKTQMCGLIPTIMAIEYANNLGAGEIKVLKYANSQDTQPTLRVSKVVGYLSAAALADYEEPKKEPREVKAMLDPIQRKTLLNIARKSIEKYLSEHKKMQLEEDDEVLNKHMGAFVTLHNKGNLRGCIGHIVGQQPLYLTVRDMAIAAATQDHRFEPVTIDELSDIDIEVSVLSEPVKISNPEEIEMGKHGVIVKSPLGSGVFLPQVATETGWDRETFMSNLCAHKARVSPDAWKKGLVETYTFTAEVFSESSH